MSGLFGAKSVNVSTSAPIVSSLRLQTSAFGRPIPFGAGRSRVSANLLWYADFTAIPHTTTTNSGGGGGKGGGGESTQSNTTYTYTAAMLMGVGRGQIDGIFQVWRDKEKTTLAALGFSYYPGSSSQTPFPHLTSHHPSEALAYRGLAYVASASVDLGDAAQLRNHSFEVQWPLRLGTAGQTPRTFTASAQVWSLRAPGHGFANNDMVRLYQGGLSDESGVWLEPFVPPPPLAIDTNYYLVGVSADTFGLALTLGGAAIVITGAGSGAGVVQNYTSDRATSFTVSVVSAPLTSTAHGLSDGLPVRVSSTGTLPAPLAAGADYFVLAPATNSLSLAATPGGAAIAITSVGSGVHSVVPSVNDAEPTAVADMILELAGVPGARIAAFTDVANYCIASGLFIAPSYTEQTAAAELLAGLAQIANAEVVYSEDLIKLVSYADGAVSGNGATFTPNVTPVFDLTEDDFLSNDGSDPVEFVDERTDDAYNSLQLKFYNRANGYNEDVVEVQDDDHIAINGRRPMDSPIQRYEIVDAAVARQVAQSILQRQLYCRRGYRFKLGPGKADLLEPMDLLTLTHARLGLSAEPVRIMEIEELGDDGEEEAEDGFYITVKEFPSGALTPALYSTVVSGGYSVDYNADPGMVNPPVIFDAPGRLSPAGYEVWLAVSALDANWGGCQVWVATESGGPYRQVGSIYGAARHGYLAAPFPAGPDPDVTNTCAVDLTRSGGALTGGTAAAADLLQTLSWIEGELISFETATLTGASRYTLEDYLRRGVYNTDISAHIAGERFVRLDTALVRYAYTPDLIGQTLYVKLPSFNVHGFALQSLADVVEYGHIIAGPIGAPSDVTGASAQQSGDSVIFACDQLQDENLDAIEVRLLDFGDTAWGNGQVITNILRGRTSTSKAVPIGTWTFLFKARDLSGKYSRNPARVDLVVGADGFTTILARQSAPDWSGVLSGFVRTVGDALIPDSTLAANAHTNAELFEQFVPYPVAACTYTAPEMDKGIDAEARVWGDIVSTLGRGVTAGSAAPKLRIDTRLEAGSYDGFADWQIGTANFRRLKSQIVLDPAVGRAIITVFTTTIDYAAFTQSAGGLAVGPAGSAYTFARPFHLAPRVIARNEGATPLLPTATGITGAGFTLHLFNTAGTEVGGTGGYDATSV